MCFSITILKTGRWDFMSLALWWASRAGQGREDNQQGQPLAYFGKGNL